MNRFIFYILFILFINLSVSFADVQRPFEENRDFSSSKFNDWLLVASFDKDNIPSFKFIESDDEKFWELNNSDIKEYFYKGKNSKAGIFFINNMQYYQYRGYNPLYSINRNKDNADIIKRFYFYRFTGKGGGVISLDNTLVAIDIYTKDVYIYGVPIEEDKVFGVEVPLKWGPSDNVVYRGSLIPFYKYDPVGHVNEDGTVVLYPSYKNSFLDKENRYQPFYNKKYIYR